jgi:hypothetical protein
VKRTDLQRYGWSVQSLKMKVSEEDKHLKIRVKSIVLGDVGE